MYNLNYRFDSVSPAGKFSGTALDLIKKYNELAKEASAAGNYVEMEVFRQYAEHYRKIVTDINERKSANQPQQTTRAESSDNESNETQAEQSEPVQTTSGEEVITQQPLSLKKKTLKVIEVKETDSLPKETKQEKPKRIYKRKDTEAKEETPAAV